MASTSTSGPLERFWAKVDKQPGGCWIWTGSKNNGGYGQYMLNGKCVRTHRVAYTAFKGEIPDGAVVHHKCGVRDCCNPEHLQAVSHRENCQTAKPGTTGPITGHFPDDYTLTVAQVAARLGVSSVRVRTLIEEGRLQALKVTGRMWLVREPLVDPRKPRGRPRKEHSK